MLRVKQGARMYIESFVCCGNAGFHQMIESGQVKFPQPDGRCYAPGYFG